MITFVMEIYNMISTEKHQKYQDFDLEKVINRNTLQVKKYDYLMKEE